ncbi:hypothetical protein Sjap_007694 [Stephania japonica]|uniref:MsrB domain-containing protein n=1 Tax=Stephania japonica TaxID=461633 RepID=A0AAP0JQB1_9MAGN
MGFQLLRISPIRPPKPFLFNPKTPLTPFLAQVHPPRNSASSAYTHKKLSPISTLKHTSSSSICSSGSCQFGGLFDRRGFRSGVVAMAATGSVQKSEEEWRAVLSPEQFRILREKGTETLVTLVTEIVDQLSFAVTKDNQQLVDDLFGAERMPGTGEYNKFYEEGVYNCAGCGTPLYKSTTKFDSGCGWPAFFEGLPGAIACTPDPDGRRIEITCAACGGHLGHVFKGEGFATPTNERHCVNSVSIKFVPAESSSM